MDIDIRKESRHGKVDIHRPHQGSIAGGSSATNSPRTPEAQVYHEPVSDNEDDDEEVYTRTGTSDDEARHMNLPDNVLSQVNAARAFRENKLREEEAEREARRAANGGVDPEEPSSSKGRKSSSSRPYENGVRVDPLSGSKQFDTKYSSMLDSLGLSKLFKTKQQREEEEARGEDLDPEDAEPEMVRFRAPEGKRISVPVRIEPKVSCPF
jgi:hypothetical protein